MKLVAVLFVLVSIILILVILLQKGRGGGLTAAFGGGMGGGLLGSKTGDFLTWVTIVLVGVFLTLAVLMGRFYKPSYGDFGQDPNVATEQTATEGSAATDDGTTTPPAEVEVAEDANSAGR